MHKNIQINVDHREYAVIVSHPLLLPSMFVLNFKKSAQRPCGAVLKQVEYICAN
jgi:hypothetical protein